jgi:coproporphyrinogen III oxidase-like Fe-S oxidoreductase
MSSSLKRLARWLRQRLCRHGIVYRYFPMAELGLGKPYCHCRCVYCGIEWTVYSEEMQYVKP